MSQEKHKQPHTNPLVDSSLQSDNNSCYSTSENDVLPLTKEEDEYLNKLARFLVDMAIAEHEKK